MKPQAIIFLCLFSTQMGLALLNPVLPPLARVLAFSEVQAGFIFTGAAFMFVLMSPFWGRRSEVLGRKTTIMIGLLGFPLGFGIFASVMRAGLAGLLPITLLFALLVSSRMIVGALFSAVPVSAQAYIADTTSNDERTSAMALIAMANGLGLIAGPALGGLMARWGLLVPIYVGAVLPLIPLLLTWRLLPKVVYIRPATPVSLSPFDPRIWPFLLIALLSVATTVSVQISSGFYFQDQLGISGAEAASAVGVALMLSGAAVLSVQLGIVRRFQLAPLTLLRTGLPIGALGLLSLLLASNYGMLLLGFTLMGAGVGFSVPGFIAAATLMVGKDEQGAVAGLTSAAQGSGATIGPLIGTLLYQQGTHYPYLLGFLLLLSLSLFVWLNVRVRAVVQVLS